MELQLTGLWVFARETFPDLAKKIPAAINVAVEQEAQDLRKRIVKQFREQSPASGSWAPLSELTLRARRIQGFNGRKILIRTGDLRNSIQVVKVGPGVVFVGVNRTAGYAKAGGNNQKTSSGKKAVSFKAISPSSVKSKPMALINLGLIHEFGATFTITVSRAMQRFLFGVLLKGAGKGRDLSGKFLKKGAQKYQSKGKFKVGARITIRIPARPFMGPAVNAKSPREYEVSLANRMATILRGKIGKP